MGKENSLLFLGDVVPYKSVKFNNKFKTVINLECPILKSGRPAEGKINLSAKENFLSDIFKTNLICVSLGNNHILDFGKEGLESTLSELKKTNVKWFGLNDGDSDNYQPLKVVFNGIEIAFFSVVCPSTSPIIKIHDEIYLSLLNVDKIVIKIQEIRKSVQRIILFIHWGIEESSYPTKEDVIIARKLIEAGVDIIIGSHAHAPQAIETYKNGIIAYNLGNFLMPELKNIPTYFDVKGIPQSTFSKKLLIWNRISWGLIINIDSMEFKIRKYFFLLNRIIELPFTPLDIYIRLKQDPMSTEYDFSVNKHVKKRQLYRKIIDFLYSPHIPQSIIKKKK